MGAASGDHANSSFPALRATPAGTIELPLTFTRFAGRERELADLQGLLLGENARLVRLLGPGGSGKTRLAIEVARRMVAHFHGAV